MAEQPRIRCPICGRLDVVEVRSRMAEMPPDRGTRIWRRIGRVYIHPGYRQRASFCDEVLAEVTDVETV